MSHGIANVNGQNLFAIHRAPAWHRLVDPFTRVITDPQEMLREAHLDYTVELVPATLEGYSFALPTFHVVTEINGSKLVLGTTGKRYTIVQNTDAFAFLANLGKVGGKDNRWESAFALKDGRMVVGVLTHDREVVLDPNGVADKVSNYILVYTSHDGSTALCGGVTPIRVVCQNTLNAALPGLKQTFMIRHTASAAERMAAELELWRNTDDYLTGFEAFATEAFQKKVTDAKFWDIVNLLHEKPEQDVKGSLAKWTKVTEGVMQAWNGAPNAGIKNTAWGAWNALTERNQWLRQERKGAKGTENFAIAGMGLDLATNAYRNKARELVMA